MAHMDLDNAYEWFPNRMFTPTIKMELTLIVKWAFNVFVPPHGQLPQFTSTTKMEITPIGDSR